MTEQLVRVVADDFVAGFVIVDDIATEAAPILASKGIVGKNRAEIREFFQRQGWKATVVKPNQPPVEHESFLHYCHCGAWGSFGFGVRLRSGNTGVWYCAEHRPV